MKLSFMRTVRGDIFKVRATRKQWKAAFRTGVRSAKGGKQHYYPSGKKLNPRKWRMPTTLGDLGTRSRKGVFRRRYH